jgi:hypothetical protein
MIAHATAYIQVRWSTPWSIQSARLSLQSSELAPPVTSPASEYYPPGFKGEIHSLAGEGADEATDTLVYSRYRLYLEYTRVSIALYNHSRVHTELGAHLHLQHL